jgi:hypothetical protein
MKRLIVICALLLSSEAFAKTTAGKSIDDEHSDFTGFWNSFKFKNIAFPKIQAELGLLAYSITYNNNNKYSEQWKLARFEPYIRLQWAILEKYLQPYFLISLERTALDYKITGMTMNGSLVDFDMNLRSGGMPFLGAGLQFFIIGWKTIDLYGYGQVQITSVNEASVTGANLRLGSINLDVKDLATNGLAITYNLQRYDCGTTLSWQALPWLQPWASIGYIWFSANIKFMMDSETVNYLHALGINNTNSLIPKKVGFESNGVFAMFGVKFRIFRRFNLNLSGTVAPGDQPLYMGQAAIIVEGEK